MALSEFRNTSSWKSAIELGPQLVRLAEDLPAAEQMGLSYQLRQSMIDLPAAIAADITGGKDGNQRRTAVVRLIATLDLIDRVYPALDTADVRAAAERLADQITTSATGDSDSASYQPVTTPASSEHPAEPKESNAAPSTVPVLPEQQTEATKVPVIPEHNEGGQQESHVHPNSGQ